MKSKKKAIHAEGLEKSLSKNPKPARRKRGGADHDHPKSGRNARRAVANARKLSPLARLVQSLGEEGIRFQMVSLKQRRWLPDMDLNHDKQIQSLLCYRYTIGQ